MSGLTLAANKGIHATGPNTLATHDLTPAGRALVALAGSSGAKVPVITGAGTAALRDIVGSVGQAGGVPTGAIVERGANANGEYVRFADGTQICTKTLTGLGPVSLAWGNVFWNNTTHVVGAWAAPFAEAPSRAASREGGSGANVIISLSNAGTTTAGGAVLMVSGVSSAATDYVVRVVATGRWF